jgi:hypothetical protein
MDQENLDTSHYQRKEAEYYAKSRAATDQNIKSAYEAAAREYAYQAMVLKKTKKL